MCCLCFLCLRDSRRAAPSGDSGCGGRGLGQASGSPVAKQATQPEEREGVQPANRLQTSILLHLFALPHVPPGNWRQSKPAPHQSTKTKPDTVQAPAASEHTSNIVFFGKISQRCDTKIQVRFAKRDFYENSCIMGSLHCFNWSRLYLLIHNSTSLINPTN